MHMNEKTSAYSEQTHVLAHSLNTPSIGVVPPNIEVVDSLLHPLAILLRQLLTRSGRSDLNLILIDDEENIVQALDAGVQIHSLYYAGSESLSANMISRLPAQAEIYEVAKRTCKKLFESDKLTRVFAIAHTPTKLGLEHLLPIPRDIVVLEDLTISGNIGAIVRSSVAFGAGGIVLLNANTSDIYDRRLIRASRGHIFSLPVVTATTESFIDFCRRHDLPILVMAAQAGHLVQEAASLPRRVSLVFGSEKDGCSQRLRDAATRQVQIPIRSQVESLNVSTAAGIVLYNRFWFNASQARK